MEKTKVLFIAQEITPYLPETEMSSIGRYLPQGIQEKGKEIRTFMPKFGSINERRNQLHEVIRLSGMNLIIDDTDHPLIIKVASIQTARMQVYFIDNEDYFQRKFALKNENGEFFDDNDERAIFYARGVIETVRKLRWSPDIIHCHGWITSLVPLYIKKAFKDDPLFTDSKIIYSIYDDGFDNTFNNTFKRKLKVEGITDNDISILDEPNYINFSKLAIEMSDAIIIASQNIDEKLQKHISYIDKSVLAYQSPDEYIDSYSNFYDEVLANQLVKSI
ncbi:MAG: glycogen/starch synthase [Bacteroidales bacterium]|nr:glycogen/starch synthase [Bacteroidales bacterium]